MPNAQRCANCTCVYYPATSDETEMLCPLCRENKHVDIQIENHGSIVMLHMLTTTAKEWVKEHTGEEAQFFGNALVVEPRYVRDIIQGAINDGLIVR